MAFRDELAAARSRAEALERELAELRAENARLRAAAGGAGEAPLAIDVEPPSTAAQELPAGSRLATFAVAAAIGLGLVGLLAARLGPLIAAGAFLSFFALFAAVIVASRLLVRPRPGEHLLLVGRPRTVEDGRKVGYRVVPPGGALRVPLLERVDRLDARLFRVQLSLTNVYCRGGEPLRVAGSFAARVHTGPRLDHAIERFLGQPLTSMARVARDVVEGTVRRLAAELTPEEMRGDPEKLNHAVLAAAEEQLDELGLHIDTLSLHVDAS